MAILTSGGERHATERRSESAARVICPPRRVSSVEQFGDAIVAMDVLLLEQNHGGGINAEFHAEKSWRRGEIDVVR